MVTVLDSIEAKELFVGALCSSVCPDNGMWYSCTINKIIQPTEEDE
jgi:hypothetical protein